MATEHYSIKDLERLSGIRAHTIRTWEQRYGLFSPVRTATNLRRYSSDDLKNVINIGLLNRSGYKISALAGMTVTERERLSAELLNLKDRLRADDQDLLLALLEMDEVHFNRTFDKICDRLGFIGTISDVIFPFFQKIGELWQSGTIDPGQEHFFSNLVRTRLAAATVGLPKITSDKKTALLFLPAEELHELAMLFYNYVLRYRGYHTWYLGAGVPADAVTRFIGLHQPAVIVTGLTTPIGVSKVEAFVSELCTQAPFARIFFTGPVFSGEPALPLPNAYRTGDLIQFLEINLSN